MAETAHDASAAAAEDLDELVAGLAAKMTPGLDALAARIADEIHEQMPEFGRHARVTERTRAAVRAELVAFATMMRAGVPGNEVPVAAEALEYARAAVHRGIALPLVMRCFNLGHALLWRAWSDAIESHGMAPQTRAAVTGVITTSMFDFIDRASAAMVDEYLREREQWVRSADALRAETIEAILADEPVDVEGVSRTLGYDLRRWHLAIVLWDDRQEDGEHRFTALLRAARDITTRVAPGQAPLAIATGGHVMRAWIGTVTRPDEALLAELTQRPRDDGVSVAIGEPAHDLDGFRETHVRAMLTRRVMRLADVLPGRMQRYSRVALPALLTDNLDQMRMFVVEELGALVADDDATMRLRATLLVYLEEGTSAAATARRLGVHTNTVNYRLRRCAELRGRPVGERRVELEVALVLRQQLHAVTFAPVGDTPPV